MFAYEVLRMNNPDARSCEKILGIVSTWDSGAGPAIPLRAIKSLLCFTGNNKVNRMQFYF